MISTSLLRLNNSATNSLLYRPLTYFLCFCDEYLCTGAMEGHKMVTTGLDGIMVAVQNLFRLLDCVEMGIRKRCDGIGWFAFRGCDVTFLIFDLLDHHVFFFLSESVRLTQRCSITCLRPRSMGTNLVGDWAVLCHLLSTASYPVLFLIMDERLCFLLTYLFKLPANHAAERMTLEDKKKD